MWRRYLPALFLAVLVVAVFTRPSLAEADTSPSSTQTVSMQGQGSIVGTQQQPQLRLKFSAVDSSGWLLELALNPAQAGGTSRSLSVLGLDGTYVLGVSGKPLSTGKATGTIDQAGHGDIKVTDSRTSTSLDVPFSAGLNGTITADVAGQWPTLPSAQATTTVTPKTQPANHFFWYLSRVAGLVSYTLLFLSLCLGMAFKSQRSARGGGRWRVLDLHQFLAVLGLAMVGLHVFSLLGDKYFSLTLGQLLIPMASPYRPVPMATGILGFYASVVAVIAWYLRKSIGSRAWRILHSSAVIVFLLGLIHGITSGTDTSSLWVQLLYTVSGGLTVFAGLLQVNRFLRHRSVGTIETRTA